MSTSHLFTDSLLAQGFTYSHYRQHSEELFEQGRSTGSDHYQTPEILEYTRLNLQRMHRLEKTVQLNEALVAELGAITQSWVWVVLTESWCGDAAQSLPVLAKMAAVNPLIELRLLLRDQNLPVMDAYLTRGGRSIPKLICLRRSDWQELGTWGPRPVSAQQLLDTYKAEHPQASLKEVATILHGWYADNRTQALQTEMTALVASWRSQ